MFNISGSKYINENNLKWNKVISFDKVYLKNLLTRENSKSFGVSIRRIDCNGKVPKHSHEEESLYYFLEGNGKVYLGKEVNEIEPGLVVYISSWEIHGIENTGLDSIKYIEIKSPNTF